MSLEKHLTELLHEDNVKTLTERSRDSEDSRVQISIVSFLKGDGMVGIRIQIWSSYEGLTVDTLAHRGDEGRGYLR